MESKIQELTEKLYREGVTKGEEDAREIIRDAEQKSKQLLAEAKARAEKIILDAVRQAEELKTTVDVELKLSAQQALNTIKQKLIDMITAQVLDAGITNTLSNPELMKDLIATIVKNWNAASPEAVTLSVVLPENKQKELEKTFVLDASGVLTRGLNVSFSKNIKGGFKIGPADGSYKISLTDEDFKEFFKEFLRPRTRKYLFDE